jgi:hypothetical protein
MREYYHGWLIELVQQGDGYLFQCWTAQGRIRLSDRTLYFTLEQALVAARMKADLESVSWALTRFLDDACLRYKLTIEEVILLKSSITKFAMNLCETEQSIFDAAEEQAMQPLGEILCVYKNETPRIQVARIANIPGWYFEKVIFPGERLLFEALPEAELEIYTGTDWGGSLVSQTLCLDLQVRSSEVTS